MHDFIEYIYEKYGNDSKKKVLSTQELHDELLAWLDGGDRDKDKLHTEIKNLRASIASIRKVLSTATYSMPLYNIKNCLKKV